MVFAIMPPLPTGGISPDDFTAINALMRDTACGNAGIDAEKSVSSRKILADRPDDDEVYSEIEAYNRSLEYTLLINSYLLGREAVAAPDVRSRSLPVRSAIEGVTSP